MSKKSNAEKILRRQSAARKRYPRQSAARKRYPLSLVPPNSAIAEAAMDLALGQMFVQFLRATGIREKVTEVVIEGQCEGSSE